MTAKIEQVAVVEDSEKCTIDPVIKSWCESIGLPYCDGCCDSLRTNDDGSTLCRTDNVGCLMKKRRGR